MGLFIRRLFWFVLVVASALVAGLLGATQYGIKVDLNAWATMSGLQGVPGITEIINKVPELMSLPMIQSYGFYASLATCLIFMLIFKMSLRSGSGKTTAPADTQKDNTQTSVETDKQPSRLVETHEQSSEDAEIIAETNSDAVVGTDGEVYDGTATFSGADTYSSIDPFPEGFTPISDDEEPDDEVEGGSDSPALATISAADASETALSHLTDAELKSKTLDCAEDMRSLEADYQDDRDAAASGLSEFSNSENTGDEVQIVKDAYEERQTAFSSEFENRYRPEAVAIRHEIAKRLGMSEPYEDFNPALDQGMLVGANPVTDAADLIEELVKKLV